MTVASPYTIYLASSSPRRHELVRMLHLPVVIYPSDADETIQSGTPPELIVQQLSLRKANAVKERLLEDGMSKPGIVIVGSDTIVVLNDTVLGKPQDHHEAFQMLTSLQGQSHEVLTGIALLDLHTNTSIVKHRLTKVHMKSLTTEQIERYIATGEPMDKAGSYGIQGRGAAFIDSIEGCYFNVVGLSISLLSDMLSEMDIQVL